MRTRWIRRQVEVLSFSIPLIDGKPIYRGQTKPWCVPAPAPVDARQRPRSTTCCFSIRRNAGAAEDRECCVLQVCYFGATPTRVDLGKLFTTSAPTFWPIAAPTSVEL